MGMAVGGMAEMVHYLLTEDAILLIFGSTVLVVIHFLAVQINQLVMLVKLKRRLAAGLPMDRETRYPRSFWRHGFQIVLVGVVMLSVVVGSALYQREPLKVDPAGYPHVALAEVVSEEDFEENLIFSREAQLKTSLLVPVQLRYRDRAFRNDEEGNRARIYLDYRETVSAWAAKVVLHGMMYDQERGLKTEREWQAKYPDRFQLIVRDTGAVWTEHDALDELWVWDVQYEDAELFHRHYFGRKGNVAFELTTTLPEPDGALEILLEKIPS
jgi:hypothetical protein